MGGFDTNRLQEFLVIKLIYRGYIVMVLAIMGYRLRRKNAGSAIDESADIQRPVEGDQVVANRVEVFPDAGHTCRRIAEAEHVVV